MNHVLILANQPEIRTMIRGCLGPEFEVEFVADKLESFEKARKRDYELVLVELDALCDTASHKGCTDYRSELGPFWQACPHAELLVLCRPEQIREAVNAVKAGASNYLTYPVNPDEFRYVLESLSEALRLQIELDYLRDRFWQHDSRQVVRTHNATMKSVFDKVRTVAPTKATVLLLGETGTGKGVVARLIHRHSTRNDKQFIAVHCGAMPDTLLESELFGHEKGAFTGATRRKLGRFEIAHGGTIFLDEIATITPSAQIKLLQVLQDRSFQRVGSELTVEADVRVIAASNVDLRKMSEQGLFRRDLYYRLNVFPIEIPPLRERVEDLPILIEIFLKRLNKLYPKQIHDVHPEVMKGLRHYSWPGNIRELENLVERAYILERSGILRPESFPGELFASASGTAHMAMDTSLTLNEVRRRGIEDLERLYLQEQLAAHSGRINASAQAAGISTRQLRKLLAKYAIHKEEFK